MAVGLTGHGRGSRDKLFGEEIDGDVLDRYFGGLAGTISDHEEDEEKRNECSRQACDGDGTAQQTLQWESYEWLQE